MHAWTTRRHGNGEWLDVQAGLLPARYGITMQEIFLDHLRPLLKPGIAILDVGGGSGPVIVASQRPPGCRYVRLDITHDEQRGAVARPSADAIAHDIRNALPSGEHFDVVLSWHALDHVRPLDRALDNLRAATRPGATMLVQVTGSFAAFTLLGRVTPARLRAWATTQYMHQPRERRLATGYDHCYASALERMLESWSSVTIHPFYRGATYLRRWWPLQHAYLGYESFVARRDARNLATHYLVVATR